MLLSGEESGGSTPPEFVMAGLQGQRSAAFDAGSGFSQGPAATVPCRRYN